MRFPCFMRFPSYSISIQNEDNSETKITLRENEDNSRLRRVAMPSGSGEVTRAPLAAQVEFRGRSFGICLGDGKPLIAVSKSSGEASTKSQQAAGGQREASEKLLKQQINAVDAESSGSSAQRAMTIADATSAVRAPGNLTFERLVAWPC